jgi:two-component system, LytTR family, response regulator
VKVLIVEDQADTRDSLIQLCERRDDVQVVGEVACGAAAMDAAGPLDPDIVLLGVELPDMSGFDLLRAVAPDAHPLGIVASNDAGHATRAFEEGAFDYLLMPVAAARFDQAMTRAQHRLHHALPHPPRFLVGERLRRLYPLDPRSIDYIEADGNYVTLRAGKAEYLSRDSIKRLALQLADLGFMRIERSLLLNASAVAYAEVARHGTFAFTLNSGVCLHSSAAYRNSILRVIPLPALSKRYRGVAS